MEDELVEEQIRVFLFECEDTAPTKMVFMELDGCLEWIKADFKENDPMEMEYKISIGYMTKKKIEELEEFDG